MPDQPKSPEAWLPLTISLGVDAPPALAEAPVAPAAAQQVGEEAQAYCPSPRCKADTSHTIISMYEDEIRRVQCVMCGEVHAFRKPRGSAEPAASPAQRSWDEAIARYSDDVRKNAQPYSIRTTYEVAGLVHHPVFDVGVVVEVLPDGKVDVLFQSGSRILVHGR
jgi:Zn ribbon nucleic-acid-binding protein